MGKIKKIIENELIGGTQTTDIYPVTSIKAVYDEENERLDHVLNRRGIVNISTNYNEEHLAEVLTLSQAIDKVPTQDRVLGFQGRFLTSDEGWVTYSFIGESITQWTTLSNWKRDYLRDIDISQEVGHSESKIMSQKAITNNDIVVRSINTQYPHKNSVLSTSGSVTTYNTDPFVYEVSDLLLINPLVEKLIIKGNSYYGYPSYVLYGANEGVVDYDETGGTGVRTTEILRSRLDELGAVYVRVMGKVDEFTKCVEGVNDVNTAIKESFGVYINPLLNVFKKGYLFSDVGMEFAYSDGARSIYFSLNGDDIKLSAGNIYGYPALIFFDENYRFISVYDNGYSNYSMIEIKKQDIPQGAKYIVIQCNVRLVYLFKAISGVYNPFFGSQKTDEYMDSGALVAHKKMPNVNYSSRKFTIYDDTLLVSNKIQAIIPAQEIDLQLPGTSKSILFYNVNTGLLEVHRNSPNNANYIYILSSYNNWGVIAAAFPYTVDEKPISSFYSERDIFLQNADKYSGLMSVGVPIRAVFRDPSSRGLSEYIPPICFAQVTDTHGRSITTDNFARVLNKFPQINFGIITGDIVTDQFPDSLEFYENAQSLTEKPILLTIGNHDVGETKLVSAAGTDQQVYDKFISPYINNWGVNGAVTNKSYFYKDAIVDNEYGSSKVRFISLYEYETDFELDPNDSTKLKYQRSTGALRQAQVDWLINTLHDAAVNDLGVVVFSHQGTWHLGDKIAEDWCNPYALKRYGSLAYGRIIVDILEAFINKSAINQSYQQTSAVVTTLIANTDFSTHDKTEFICHLSGHAHQDYICTLQDTSQICINCDTSNYNSLNDSDLQRGLKQDVINVIGIDRNIREISIIRFGCDISTTAQNRKFLKIKY